MSTEAEARAIIDNLLASKGWNLFDNNGMHKNVALEQGHRSGQGGQKFTDYLLLDKYNRPMVLIEAKKVSYNLNSAKSQAMDYARELGLTHFYLSNGKEHRFCAVNDGVLKTVDSFMSYEELENIVNNNVEETKLWDENLDSTILAEIKEPKIQNNPKFIDVDMRASYLKRNKLINLRPYQLNAVKAIVESAKEGNYRFLLEMATGTGKTLTCAGIIELFLKTGNAHRVLFLVDRIELEDQAEQAFNAVFGNGGHYRAVKYKKAQNNWNNAQIVVSTVQTLLRNNRYINDFKPSDFDLVIVDEAHRTINGRARAVFEYFVGYKVGLTATPKDYFRGVNKSLLLESNLYEHDERAFRDTYNTFGCIKGVPTYEYTLAQGVKAGILVQPYAIDARTEIINELLNDGIKIDFAPSTEEPSVTDDNVEDVDKSDDKISHQYKRCDFEKKLFIDSTNDLLCRMFLENAKRDPLTSEIGKTIIFCVSQRHASDITNKLNILIKEYEPDNWSKYGGEFALQVSSDIPASSSYTKAFTHEHNELNGVSRYVDGLSEDVYKTSKSRVCVTVAMMTTGYDCQDLLNICLMRPVLQPSEFIQIKGRGTRVFDFEIDPRLVKKDNFHFFDYFGNFQFFENYDYDKKLSAPTGIKKAVNVSKDKRGKEKVVLNTQDRIDSIVSAQVVTGMAIDSQFNKGTSLTQAILSDIDIKKAVDAQDWSAVTEIIANKYDAKAEYSYESNKTISKEMNIDRFATWEELVKYMYGISSEVKTREQLLEDAVTKCMKAYSINELKRKDIKRFVNAYVASKEVRECIKTKMFANLDYTGVFELSDFKKIGIDINQSIMIASSIEQFIPEQLNY